MTKFNFNKNIIINVLDQLNIDYDSDHVIKNWMLIRCPLHPDKNMSNAGINLQSGIIFCFSCKQKSSIIKLYMERYHCNYSTAINKIFGNEFFLEFNNIFKNVKKSKEEEKEEEKKDIINYDIEKYITLQFDPLKYWYTNIRGFTKSFCKKFGIVHCVSDIYNDYFLIPIIDKKKNIKTFEARKLKQKENIEKYYNNIDFNSINLSPEEFFKNEIEKNGFKIKKDFVFDKNGRKIYSNLLFYLLKPKVLYPSKSDISGTIWNIDNLNYNEELWISEGLGSIPKIYENISKNCTATFGSNISKEQIEYLCKFKKVIIVSDNDKASFEMIKKLNLCLNNLYVSTCEVEDTNVNFVKELKTKEIIRASQYILRNSFKKL